MTVAARAADAAVAAAAIAAASAFACSFNRLASALAAIFAALVASCSLAFVSFAIRRTSSALALAAAFSAARAPGASVVFASANFSFALISPSLGFVICPYSSKFISYCCTKRIANSGFMSNIASV